MGPKQDRIRPGPKYVGAQWSTLFSTLTNIRKLGIVNLTEKAMEVLSGATPISEKLEKLRLDGINGFVNLSSYQNLHQLKLIGGNARITKV